MTDPIEFLFDTSNWPSRWNCGRWTAGLGWTHIIADILTFISYTAIPVVLAVFALRRRDLPFPRLFWLFCAFIFACGTTHLIEASIFWWPLYRLSALAKVSTGVVSAVTVCALIPAVPKLLALPGLALINTQLEGEIGQRRNTEDELRQSNERLRAIVEHAVDGIITIDARGRITSFNPAAERLFGYRSEEVCGKNVSLLMPPPYSREHDQYLDRYLKTGEARIIGIGREVRGRRKDGTVFPVDLSVSESRIGSWHMFTGIVRDITDRKEAEETIRRQQQDLEDFVSIVAHDLKHPVVSIAGLLSILEEDNRDRLDDESRENVRLAISECDHMRSIISQLSHLSSIGRMQTEPELVHLPSLIQQVARRLDPARAEKGVEVRIECADLSVMIEKVQIEEALENLLDNAIKYGCREPGDRVCISARVDSIGLEIKVVDSGPGIPAQFHQRVFELFRRLEPGQSDGTGVGLAAVRKLVQSVGGSVELESEEGKGATFTIRCPLKTRELNQRV